MPKYLVTDCLYVAVMFAALDQVFGPGYHLGIWFIEMLNA